MFYPAGLLKTTTRGEAERDCPQKLKEGFSFRVVIDFDFSKKIPQIRTPVLELALSVGKGSRNPLAPKPEEKRFVNF